MRTNSTLRDALLIIGVAASVGVTVYFLSIEYNDQRELAQETELQPSVDTLRLVDEQQVHTPIIRTDADRILAECKNDVHCAHYALEDMAKKEDTDKVLETFKELIEKYDANKIACHETAHHLGMYLYGLVRSNLTKALSYAGQNCGGAVFHGVIENHLISQRLLGNKDPSEIQITDVCPEFSDNEYAIARWQCIHGIGHGLAEIYNYDIMKALDRCEGFKPGWEQISCSKGIFMENVVKYYETGNGDFDQKNLFYPCDAAEEKYVPACYHYHTSYILKQKDFYVKRTFNECDNVKEEFIKYCYHGMGRQLLSASKGIMQNAIMLCQIGNKTAYHSDCFRGMVMILVNNDRDPVEGFLFCRNLPVEHKTDCYDAMGKWVRMLHGTEEGRAKECSRAESQEYRSICMTASLGNIRLL